MLVTPNHLFSGVFFVDFSISDLADSLWQNQLRYILLVCENVWDIWKFLWDEILSSWCSRPLERDQQSLKWSSNKNTSQVPRPTCFSKNKWVGEPGDKNTGRLFIYTDVPPYFKLYVQPTRAFRNWDSSSGWL